MFKKGLRFKTKWDMQEFPGSSAGKESTCNAGDPDPIPRLGNFEKP